jgi:hypothetical protein
MTRAEIAKLLDRRLQTDGEVVFKNGTVVKRRGNQGLFTVCRPGGATILTGTASRALEIADPPRRERPSAPIKPTGSGERFGDDPPF